MVKMTRESDTNLEPPFTQTPAEFLGLDLYLSINVLFVEGDDTDQDGFLGTKEEDPNNDGPQISTLMPEDDAADFQFEEQEDYDDEDEDDYDAFDDGDEEQEEECIDGYDYVNVVCGEHEEDDDYVRVNGVSEEEDYAIDGYVYVYGLQHVSPDREEGFLITQKPVLEKNYRRKLFREPQGNDD